MLNEEVHYDFQLGNSIRVAGGSALKLDVYAPALMEYGEKYTVQMSLTNTADFPLYNVSNSVDGFQQIEVKRTYQFDEDGNRKPVEAERNVVASLSGGVMSVKYPILYPGESIWLEFSFVSNFKSELQKNKEQSVNFFDAISKLAAGKATPIGRQAEIVKEVLDCVSFGEVLQNNMQVATLAGSNAVIPCELHITGEAVKRIDVLERALSKIDNKIKDTIKSWLKNNCIEVYEGMLGIDGDQRKNDLKLQKDIEEHLHIKGASKEKNKEKVEVWLEKTDGTKIDIRTGEIIPEEDDSFRSKLLTNLDGFSDELYDELKDETLPLVFDLTENLSGKSAKQNAPLSKRRSLAGGYMLKASAVDEEPAGFTLNIMPEDEVIEENGHYFFDGDALIGVTATSTGDYARLCVRYEDGTLDAVFLESVPEHESGASASQMIVSIASSWQKKN